PSTKSHYLALPAARRYMGDARKYAERVDLALMTPQDSLSSTKYCLANPGSHYIIYQPNSGSFNVNLVAGTYNYEWFNPISGVVVESGIITVSNGNKNFVPPFSGEAVLYLSTSFSESPFPSIIPQTDWALKYVNSEELNVDPRPATNTFDGDANTFWTTEWRNIDPVHPHEIQIDLGGNYDISGFKCLPRQDANYNGGIKDYEFYVSSDGETWDDPVAVGTFEKTKTEKTVLFSEKTGRYVRLVALSEVNNNAWTTMAELNVLGIKRPVFDDTVPPQVTSFNINPTVNINSPITVIYTVTDNQALKQVELWRTTDDDGIPNSGNWTKMNTKTVSGTSASGSFTDSISTVGTYHYGIHVVDQAGNVGYEPECICVVVDYSESVNLPKLVVSSDGHYIETENGEPFMWVSETLWYMVQRTTREDVEYLLDRLSGITDPKLGGTTVVKSTIAMRLSGDLQNPVNAYGHQAFNGGNVPDLNSPKVVVGGGPDSPNDYWDHLDFMVRETKERGMYFVLLPYWSNAYVNGAYSTQKIDAETARSYGEWLGNRYKNENHVLWMLGGDGNDPFPGNKKDIYRAQAEGILKGVTGCTTDCPAYNEPDSLWDEVLILYHGHIHNVDLRASKFWDSDEKWMDIDGVYGGYREHFWVLTDAYNQPVPRPVVETEGFGYYIDAIDDEVHLGQARAIHYMHYLSGGMGPEYMSQYIWDFTGDWKTWLSIPQREEITILKSVMSSVAWHTLIPDKEIILSDNGLGNWEEIMAARSSDGDLIMAFFSTFTSSSVVIDLSAITTHSCVQGTWINPSNGTTQDAGKYAASATSLFTVPDAWVDAMLKLEGISGEIDDPISQTNWLLHYVDSEEFSDTPAINSFDGDTVTIWSTEWRDRNPIHPHEIQSDLGNIYEVSG
ncbi:MAG: DUF4038 domain-containing protein, partial [Cyclobacteriaceae bacterium]|nr:DUF4038 domain-containing protein [Cyclobacteriaceae bacterium]